MLAGHATLNGLKLQSNVVITVITGCRPFKPFAPGGAVTSGSAIPYSWQVSRIGPANQIDLDKKEIAV